MHQEPQINPSLENMQAACAAAGHPERAYSIIQITGTNGKTSTARIIEQLLIAEGLKTGLYTSPSLICDTERIRVGGNDISASDLAAAKEAARVAATSIDLQLTAFEEMTLAMFIHFQQSGVDFAVVEVGMGGRWDATSAAHPAVAVITAVGLDHQEFLGDTHEEIAFDKAHIIKPGASVVLGRSLFSQHEPHIADIFINRAKGFGLHPRSVTDDVLKVIDSAPLKTEFAVTTLHANYSDLHLPAASYQASNAATAIMAAEAALGRALDTSLVRTTLSQLTFPGRFEVIRKEPLLIFDGSHNPAAAHMLARQIASLTEGQLAGEKPIIALGILNDKDAKGIIAALAPVAAGFIVLEPASSRAIPAAQLAKLITEVTGQAPSNQQIETIRQPLIITGSLSLYPLLQSFSM